MVLFTLSTLKSLSDFVRNRQWILFLHFLLFHVGVEHAATKDGQIWQPPKARLYFSVPLGGYNSLEASFGSTRYIVGEWGSHLSKKKKISVRNQNTW